MDKVVVVIIRAALVNLVLRLNVYSGSPADWPVCFDIVSRYFVDNSSNHNYYCIKNCSFVCCFFYSSLVWFGFFFVTTLKNMDYDAVAIQI